MIRTICAFLAMVLTALQAYFIYSSGSGICFNDGCEIVEKLTTVPPLYFNLLGALFFGTIFIGSLISCINESKNSEHYTRLLLTAALAAEAVLLFFQWSIARTFCSYCLIIFFFVLLLNLLSGGRQIVRGLLVFCSVLIASFSLQFDAGGAGKSLSFGTVAQYKEEGNEKNLLLIFSTSCQHCEKVIDFLRKGSLCNVAFNPIERDVKFNFTGATVNQSYDPRATIGFMRSMGMSGVPILVAPEEKGVAILNGTDEIIPYIEQHCTITEPKTKEGGMSVAPTNKGVKYQLPASSPKEDACLPETDC